jgi:hypothetical protein
VCAAKTRQTMFEPYERILGVKSGQWICRHLTWEECRVELEKSDQGNEEMPLSFPCPQSSKIIEQLHDRKRLTNGNWIGCGVLIAAHPDRPKGDENVSEACPLGEARRPSTRSHPTFHPAPSLSTMRKASLPPPPLDKYNSE